jgi:hypothetical protein
MRRYIDKCKSKEINEGRDETHQGALMYSAAMGAARPMPLPASLRPSIGASRTPRVTGRCRVRARRGEIETRIGFLIRAINATKQEASQHA